MDVTRACIGQIEKRNDYLKAVLAVPPDAIGQARRLDEERKSGRVRRPLHGIPILVKVIFACELLSTSRLIFAYRITLAPSTPIWARRLEASRSPMRDQKKNAVVVDLVCVSTKNHLLY